MLISKSTWQHLRIPFSIFLMPVFSFAVSQSDNRNWLDIGLIFVILHFLLYPASNGFNSFYDKDEKSIGGLKHPPKVSKDLLYASLIFDILAIILGFYFSPLFAFCLILYGLISKAYSHPAIRLKKYPITGLITVAIFQGAFVYIMVLIGLDGFDKVVLVKVNWWAAGICTLLLFGSYPMTQIYQHEEDATRGDETMSRILGIRGTFIFSGIAFFLADLAFALYFLEFGRMGDFLILQIFFVPVLAYFQWWLLKVWKSEDEANFENTMMLNKISSISMILYFALITFLRF